MTRAMKDSGVEWIGEIPQEWETWKLKHVASIQTGNTPTKTSPDNYSDDGLLWVKPDNLKELTPIKETNEYISDEGKPLARIAKAYSTLVCCIGTVGKIGYSNEPVAFNQQINAVDFDSDKILWKYGLYFLSCQKEQHQYYMNGNVVYILNSENHGRIKMAKPKLSEQQAISNYLDKKCAEIDAVINSKQEQNKLLKEQRQSIIYEAVTKGLDKNAQMKDSGIEWIGKTPKDWTISKVKRFYDIVLGKMLQPKSIDENDELLDYMCSLNITWNGVNIDTVKQMWFSRREKEQYRLKSGDLLVTEGGDVGVSCLWNNEIEECYLQNAVHLVRNHDGYLNKYLYYWLYALKSTGYIDLICNKATIAHFTKDKFSEIPFIVCSLNEQQDIVEYLDNKCTELDRLIQANTTTINELKEYRQSVIFETVTGKKMVC